MSATAIYSAFEVSCPNCDLKSALDHAARDLRTVVLSRARPFTRARARGSTVRKADTEDLPNRMNLSDLLFGGESPSPVSGN